MVTPPNSLPLASLFCGLVLVGTAVAQTEPTIDLNSIRQNQPSFLVRADVDQPSRQYQSGDQLTLTVASEIDAFVYVLYQQVDGQLFQVYPNSRHPDNRLAARQTVQIPANEDLFRWRIGPPYGRETIKVIATAQPLKSLSDPKLKTKDFNPVSKSTFKGVAQELGPASIRPDRKASDSPVPNPPDSAPDSPAPVPNPPDAPKRWAESDVEIVTMKARDDVPPTGKRYGVFFGVSEHKYAVLSELASGQSPNLSTPHADAKVLDALMKGVGQLTDSRVYTNETATRSNFERSICEWLPSVSRPGDTVVIYFSGHGGQVDDDNGDEADRLDEYLVPSDFFSLTAVVALLKLENEGKLPSELKELLQGVKRLISQVGVEKAGDILIRQTGVTDDLFGHWLQRLDGRQVVVVLDVCHSGGFATQEKSLEIQSRDESFDYLDRELVRLKDIGQSNTALLTASAATELSLVRLEKDLSVMTFYLANALQSHVGALDLNSAYQECNEGMDRYFHSDLFQAVNQKLQDAGRPLLKPHHPKLYNQLAKPVFLKP